MGKRLKNGGSKKIGRKNLKKTLQNRGWVENDEKKAYVKNSQIGPLLDPHNKVQKTQKQRKNYQD